ncbi:MAG: hypothetical protein IPL61_17035 [Myxococcales bacterium]|nr:hypothetical protein [Myxococcales bacterium]
MRRGGRPVAARGEPADAHVDLRAHDLNPGGALVVNGVALPDLGLPRMRAALGEPDRIERVTHAERYEEYGAGDMPSTSDLVPITDTHYVYARHGLVFATQHGAFADDATPALVRVFFAHPRVFDNIAAPAVVPSAGGHCAVTINGVRLDPEVDLRPAGASSRTARVTIFGTGFGLTSIASVIDTLYTSAGARAVHIFLDGPATGRAAYLEVR